MNSDNPSKDHVPVSRSRHLIAGGFSLVEVLASLMLATIVLPIAMRAISLSAANASLAAQRTEATALAQLKLNELIVTRDYENGEQSGDFGEDWPNYQWQANTSQWSGQSLIQVDVTVTWTHSGQERILKVSTLVFDNETS